MPIRPRRDSRVPGRVNRFRLIELLGRGSMAVVYRAEDLALRRHVALKLLPQRFRVGERTVLLDQFIREAQSAARLDHPNIVRIYEVGRDDGWFYIAMELLEGCNLYELVQSAGKLDAIRACQLAADAADALAYAHDHHVIHRDVKPGNLMLTRTGRCRVTDFGLARIIDTKDGYVLPSETVGTPYYIPPEVVRGAPADTRSDIYSLGATIWHLVTGAPPYLADHPRALMMQHVTAPLPDLHDAAPDAPNDLKLALERALTKNPDDRFATARQFAQVLRQLTVPGYDQLEPLTALTLANEQLAREQVRTTAMPRRRRTRLALVIVAAMLSAIAVAVSVTSWLAQPRPVVFVNTPMPYAFTEHTAVTTTTIESDDAAAPALTEAEPEPSPPETEPSFVHESGALRAGDLTTLQRLAASGSPTVYHVVGRVTGASLTTTGKSFRIHLDGRHGAEDFYAVVFPGLFEAMEARFGGESGSDLLGRWVRLSGPISQYGGAPQIIIRDLSQIEEPDESP